MRYGLRAGVQYTAGRRGVDRLHRVFTTAGATAAPTADAENAVLINEVVARRVQPELINNNNNNNNNVHHNSCGGMHRALHNVHTLKLLYCSTQTFAD